MLFISSMVSLGGLEEIGPEGFLLLQAHHFDYAKQIYATASLAMFISIPGGSISGSPIPDGFCLHLFGGFSQ